MQNIMLIGLPGSGKSSYAQLIGGDYIYISTDDIREELWGYADVQGPWEKIWAVVQKRIAVAKDMGCNVIYDATNLTVEHRKPVLEALDELGWTKALVFQVDPWECWKRNCRRSRVVPGDAFNKMVNMFEIPTLDEGFSEIKIIK